MTGVPPPVDSPAAVHRGLLALARRRKADFNAILVQYAIERLIDRLSRSQCWPSCWGRWDYWNVVG